VHADGDSPGASGKVVPRQGSLVTLVQHPIGCESQGMCRNGQAAA
jgi:hypothetical protein